jgi:hypothetical protein
MIHYFTRRYREDTKECVATLLEHGAQIACKTYDARVLAELSDQHEILAMLNKSEAYTRSV